MSSFSLSAQCSIIAFEQDSEAALYLASNLSVLNCLCNLQHWRLEAWCSQQQKRGTLPETKSFISGKCHPAMKSFVSQQLDKSLVIQSSRTSLGRRRPGACVFAQPLASVGCPVAEWKSAVGVWISWLVSGTPVGLKSMLQQSTLFKLFMGPLYFCPVVSFSIFYLSFFPRLISAVADWMSAILPHMVWP